MRTRIIPAQVTTVEDKIAGSLNLTQILLLIASVILSTGVFIILPIPMKLNLYKIPFVLTIFAVFGTLAVRFKERVVLNWVGLLAAYLLRPKYFVFNKNNTSGREFELVDNVKITKTPQVAKSKKITTDSYETSVIDVRELNRDRSIAIRLDQKRAIAIKNI